MPTIKTDQLPHSAVSDLSLSLHHLSVSLKETPGIKWSACTYIGLLEVVELLHASSLCQTAAQPHHCKIKYKYFYKNVPRS